MKRILFSMGIALIVLVTAVQAQEAKSTTRLQKQHKQTLFIKDHLKQTEESLLLSLKGDVVDAQQRAIQTIRDLEQLFPAYPFSSLITPLGKIVKDEKSDRLARRLAVLALDELHSQAGDAFIKDVASACDDKGLQSLCQALLIGNKTE